MYVSTLNTAAELICINIILHTRKMNICSLIFPMQTAKPPLDFHSLARTGMEIYFHSLAHTRMEIYNPSNKISLFFSFFNCMANP
mmetsp:Transcript_23016/g.33443  ORF Transcript_23016/g.33443 Transcript_23016/m.33443 type:complete len:85 (+) Transcript_23016:61-315(+)